MLKTDNPHMKVTDKQSRLEESLRQSYGEISFSGNVKPVIGISGNFRDGDCTLAEGYWSSVEAAGGIPVIIPPFDNTEAISSLADSIDGLVLSGGADIDPEYLGEEPIEGISINQKRDFPEMLLIRMAANRRIPMLGICRGIQIIAAALGGELYQDIRTQHGPDSLQHSQTGARHERSHSVMLAENSILRSLFNNDTIDVNSFHHQAVRKVPAGFKVTATAPDGIIEGMESECYRSIIGVQWHPECMHAAGDESMMPIFHWLIAQASSFKEAKQVHDSHIILDSHCDTPMFFPQGADFSKRDPKILVDVHKMADANKAFAHFRW